MKFTNAYAHPLKDVTSKNNFTQQRNLPMTDKLIAPPARVWKNIEKILDEQDSKKRQAAVSFTSAESKNRKSFPIYFAAAGASVLAGLVWLLR